MELNALSFSHSLKITLYVSDTWKLQFPENLAVVSLRSPGSGFFTTDGVIHRRTPQAAQLGGVNHSIKTSSPVDSFGVVYSV